MNNTTTQTKNKNNEHEFNLGDVQIQPILDSNDVTVGYNLPIRFFTGKRADLSEYQHLLREDVRIKAHLFFDLIVYLGEDLRDGLTERGVANVAEFIALVGTLGGSVMEASEIIEMNFKQTFRENCGGER